MTLKSVREELEKNGEIDLQSLRDRNMYSELYELMKKADHDSGRPFIQASKISELPDTKGLLGGVKTSLNRINPVFFKLSPHYLVAKSQVKTQIEDEDERLSRVESISSAAEGELSLKTSHDRFLTNLSITGFLFYLGALQFMQMAPRIASQVLTLLFIVSFIFIIFKGYLLMAKQAYVEEWISVLESTKLKVINR